MDKCGQLAHHVEGDKTLQDTWTEETDFQKGLRALNSHEKWNL